MAKHAVREGVGGGGVSSSVGWEGGLPMGGVEALNQ